jgi:prepilin peptidase CpaA
MGAGDVKMQMGFGAWVGSFYGLSSADGHHNALWVILYAFCLAVVIGGVLAVFMIMFRGNYRKNLNNTKAILGDLFGKGAGVAAENAADRKPTMHLLPYGIPLCLGFISYLICLHS